MPSISSTAGDATVHQPGSGPASADRSLPTMTRDRPFAWLLLITGVIGWLAGTIGLPIVGPFWFMWWLSLVRWHVEDEPRIRVS